MLTRALIRLTLLVALVAVALAGPHGAGRTSGEAIRAPALQAWLDGGGAVDGLCGDVSAADHNPCPLCHKLAETPGLRLAARAMRLAWLQDTPRLADLTAGPQRHNPNAAARAPPALA